MSLHYHYTCEAPQKITKSCLTAAVQGRHASVCMFICLCVMLLMFPEAGSQSTASKSLPWRAAVHTDSISMELNRRLSLLCLANTLRALVRLNGRAAQSSFLCYTVITLGSHLGLLKVGIQLCVCVSVWLTANETSFHQILPGAFTDDAYVTDSISSGRCSYVDNTNTDQYSLSSVGRCYKCHSCFVNRCCQHILVCSMSDTLDSCWPMCCYKQACQPSGFLCKYR